MFTIPYATLCNYQNTLMYKSEPRVNSTLINYVIMIYELRVKTISIHKSTSSLKIQFWI